MVSSYLDLTAYRPDIETAVNRSDGRIRVLDLGCGRGDIHDDWEQYIQRVSTEMERYHGRDTPVDVDIIGMDRDRDALAAVDNPVHYEMTGEHSFPFADDSVDIVLSNKLMPHLDTDAGQEAYVKKECDRVLKDHGFQAHASYQTPR